MGISEKAIVEGSEILRYIPHRDPIVMVDKFYGIEGAKSVSGLLVTHKNIFCENGYLIECGIIEHVAQSAALRTGYYFISKNEPVPIGFIGSVDKVKIYRLPRIGEELITDIEIEAELAGITLLSAQVMVDNIVIAECRMKVAIANHNK